MRDFRQFQVWHKAHSLHLNCYRASKSFPREDAFGLTSQLRRAALSVPTNIAEGCGRGSEADLNRFLQIAMGSASELEYLLLSARDLEMLPAPDWQALNEQTLEVKRMLSTLITRVRKSG